jgi:hypothetical protein
LGRGFLGRRHLIILVRNPLSLFNTKT